MPTERDDGLLYLRMYPALRRWVNRCATCGHMGCRPDLPERLGPGVAAGNLRRYFPEMRVNELGVCEPCAGIGRRPDEIVK